MFPTPAGRDDMGPRPDRPDRRQFLAWASAELTVVAAHDCLAHEGPGPASPSGGRREAAPRIVSLELLTATPLAAMKAFYHRSLGLPVADERPDRLTIAAGQTRLT